MADAVEVDVVVVGYGAAGACAAIEARTSGADVLVLEAAGGAGGASAMSGGLLYLGGGTALQRALGFDDDADNMQRFLLAACGPDADTAKVASYCEGSPAHLDWLVAHGVPFKAAFWDNPTSEPWDDSGLMFCGGERASPFAEIARPAPRGHCPQADGTSRTGAGGGFVLLQALRARVEALGVVVGLSASVKALDVDSSGRVVGVVARQMGRELQVRARRGVVLASGGFGFNDGLVGEHAPALLGTEAMGVDQHDGLLLREAMAIGAATRGMAAAEAAVPVPPAILAGGIVVDGTGRRFINEDAYMGRIGQQILHSHDKTAFAIFDDFVYDAAEPWRGQFVPSHVCETPALLATELGIPAGTLQATLDRYNADVDAGVDTAFGKKPAWLRRLEGPLGAIECGPLRTFTLGGLVTDPSGSVQSVEGAPIPGLFAAGRIASGLPAWGYVSGASLGDGTFFGRRAGRAAASG